MVLNYYSTVKKCKESRRISSFQNNFFIKFVFLFCRYLPVVGFSAVVKHLV